MKLAPRNQERFQQATALRDCGRLEEAISEFRALEDEWSLPDEKAAILINVHRCYCELGRLGEAKEILSEIRQLCPSDPTVCMIVEFGQACMEIQEDQSIQGLTRLEIMLDRYAEALANPEFRYLYEDIQQRRAFVLTTLGRYGESLHILREASNFLTLNVEDRQRIALYTGIAYSELRDGSGLAKEAFSRAIGHELRNDIEAQSRYRLALLNVNEGAYAQAKYQLEALLQMPESNVVSVSQKFIYEQLSIVCRYLGEMKDAQRYDMRARNCDK